MKNNFGRILGALSLSVMLLPCELSADTSDSWEFGATIYGWFPDLEGKTAFPANGGQDFEVDIGDILDNLQFTFQGTFDARKGSWGVFTDVVYLDLGNSNTNLREGTIGGEQIPVDVSVSTNLDVKSWVWTTAGYYRLVDESDKSFDFVFGLRYIDVEQTLKWDFSGEIGSLPLPGQQGRSDVQGDYWDGIIGFRGRLGFGQDNNWYLPYYADIGSGGSDFTWQAATGIGYAFDWGEIAAVWRYMDYDLPSNKPLADLNLSGPEIGATFRW